MGDIEQQRRDLKAREPALYEYIANVESAKALDSAGDIASGARDALGAANRVWARGILHEDRARQARD